MEQRKTEEKVKMTRMGEGGRISNPPSLIGSYWTPRWATRGGTAVPQVEAEDRTALGPDDKIKDKDGEVKMPLPNHTQSLLVL